MTQEQKPAKQQPNLKDIRDAARRLIARGFQPLPLLEGDKKVVLDDWTNVSFGVDCVDFHFTVGRNIGLRLDTLTDIDLDTPEAVALAPYFLKNTGARWGRPTARNSHHLYLIPDSASMQFTDPEPAPGMRAGLLEIRHGNNHQSMIPPSVHPEGELLSWEGNPEFTPEPWDYPACVRAVRMIAAGALLMRHVHRGVRYNTILYLAGAMKKAKWELEQALRFVHTVAMFWGRDNLENKEQSVKNTFAKDDAEVAGLKKLEDYLSKPVIRKLAEWLELRRTKFDPLDLSDDANARLLFLEHGENLRYLPNEGKGGLWCHWNDVIWQRDRMGFVVDLAGRSLKKKADELTRKSKNEKFIEKVNHELQNMPGIRGALDRLCCDPEIAAPSTAFDADPWLIGVQNGVYNLKTMRLEPGAREHLVSRQVQASYDDAATCPRWQTCLERVQPDPAVRDFLQRLAGACLLGEQTEHGFVFFYGKGANFKTAFSETIRRVVGDDYATTPNEELFFKGNQEVPRNYLADLHGMRLLVTSEKNEGSEWNIEFLKRLLGGQQLTACRKYCEAFTFVPTARVIAAANNKPRLNELDEALRRRFLLVPWEQTIPQEGEQLDATETDPEVILRCLRNGARIPFEHLMSLLRDERDGILRWMIAGAGDFVDCGLRLEPPKSVTNATENYFADEDIAGRFVKDWCMIVKVPQDLDDAGVSTLLQREGISSEQLHKLFTLWANFGKHSWGKAKVTRRLEKVEGVIARRGTGNAMYLNLRPTGYALDQLAAASMPSDSD